MTSRHTAHRPTTPTAAPTGSTPPAAAASERSSRVRASCPGLLFQAAGIQLGKAFFQGRLASSQPEVEAAAKDDDGDDIEHRPEDLQRPTAIVTKMQRLRH